jgi:hypothetical protein
MTIYTKRGNVKFSDDVRERMGLCNEDNDNCRCFVGDISLISDEDGGWKGDEVNIKTGFARVKLRFVDEVEPETPTGFLSRVFGVVF